MGLAAVGATTDGGQLQTEEAELYVSHGAPAKWADGPDAIDEARERTAIEARKALGPSR